MNLIHGSANKVVDLQQCAPSSGQYDALAIYVHHQMCGILTKLACVGDVPSDAGSILFGDRRFTLFGSLDYAVTSDSKKRMPAFLRTTTIHTGCYTLPSLDCLVNAGLVEGTDDAIQLAAVILHDGRLYNSNCFVPIEKYLVFVLSEHKLIPN